MDPPGKALNTQDWLCQGCASSFPSPMASKLLTLFLGVLNTLKGEKWEKAAPGGPEGRVEEEDSPHVEPVASPHMSAELDRGARFPVPPVSGTHTRRAVDEVRI